MRGTWGILVIQDLSGCSGQVCAGGALWKHSEMEGSEADLHLSEVPLVADIGTRWRHAQRPSVSLAGVYTVAQRTSSSAVTSRRGPQEAG